MLYFRSSVQALVLDTSPLKFSISEKLHVNTRALCSETVNSRRYFVSILAPLLLRSCDFQLVKFFAFLQSAFVNGLMNAGRYPSCSRDLNPCHLRCELCWRINISSIVLPWRRADNRCRTGTLTITTVMWNKICLETSVVFRVRDGQCELRTRCV
jgi:hypothetical protein